MKELDYFPFYYSYAERFSELTDEELGRAVRAACSHGMGEEVREGDRLVSMVIKTMVFDLDRARENYAQQLARKQEGGRRGAEKRWDRKSGAKAEAPAPAADANAECVPAADAIPNAESAPAADAIPNAECVSADDSVSTGDSAQDTKAVFGIPMVRNGKPGKSESESESNSKSKSKSESESKSKSESKSNRKSDSLTPTQGGVGGVSEARREFLALAGEDETLRQRLEEYLGMLSQRRRRLTPGVLQAMGRKLTAYPREQRQAVVEQSLRNGWNDLYDLPSPTRGRPRSGSGGDCQPHGGPMSAIMQNAVRAMLADDTLLP